MRSTKRTDGNDYGKALPRWKVNLALSRIRVMGFPKGEWADLLQELALPMMRFRFDPARANGASEATALCTLINNQLCARRRAAQRARENLDAYRALGGPGFYEEKVALRMGVRTAVAALPAFEQAVCRGLGRGDSIWQVAVALGCGWHTVDRTIAMIRDRFGPLGLEGWLCG